MVCFTDVTVLHHEASLDESKLPRCPRDPACALSPQPLQITPEIHHLCGSDGLAPIGLGALRSKEIRRLDSYEDDRSEARQGVGIVPPEERRQVIGIKRAASVERVENDNAELKRAHMQSVREHILELRAAQQASAPGTSGIPTLDAPCLPAPAGQPDEASSSLPCRAAEPEPSGGDSGAVEEDAVG